MAIAEIWDGPATAGTVDVHTFASRPRLVPGGGQVIAFDAGPTSAPHLEPSPALHVRSRTPADVALRRLEAVARLGPDWDMQGSPPLAAEALARARWLVVSISRMFSHIDLERAVPIAIAPLSGGGVQVEWRRPGADLEVEIAASGTINLLTVYGKGATRRYEEAEDVPREQALRAIVEVLLSEH